MKEQAFIDAKTKKELESVFNYIKTNQGMEYALSLLKNQSINNHAGMNLLGVLVTTGEPDLAKRLLSLSESDLALITTKDRDGLTLLHYASGTGETEIVKLLIQKNADVNAVDNESKTPLHYAVNAEIAQILIDNDADTNARDNIGHTPLHATILENNVEVARKLIDNVADVNAVDDQDKTPLHYATELGNRELVKLLIEKGANIDLVDEETKRKIQELLPAAEPAGEEFSVRSTSSVRTLPASQSATTTPNTKGFNVRFAGINGDNANTQSSAMTIFAGTSASKPSSNYRETPLVIRDEQQQAGQMVVYDENVNKLKAWHAYTTALVPLSSEPGEKLQREHYAILNEISDHFKDRIEQGHYQDVPAVNASPEIEDYLGFPPGGSIKRQVFPVNGVDINVAFDKAGKMYLSEASLNEIRENKTTCCIKIDGRGGKPDEYLEFRDGELFIIDHGPGAKTSRVGGKEYLIDAMEQGLVMGTGVTVSSTPSHSTSVSVRTSGMTGNEAGSLADNEVFGVGETGARRGSFSDSSGPIHNAVSSVERRNNSAVNIGAATETFRNFNRESGAPIPNQGAAGSNVASGNATSSYLGGSNKETLYGQAPNGTVGSPTAQGATGSGTFSSPSGSSFHSGAAATVTVQPPQIDAALQGTIDRLLSETVSNAGAQKDVLTVATEVELEGHRAELETTIKGLHAEVEALKGAQLAATQERIRTLQKEMAKEAEVIEANKEKLRKKQLEGQGIIGSLSDTKLLVTEGRSNPGEGYINLNDNDDPARLISRSLRRLLHRKKLERAKKFNADYKLLKDELDKENLRLEARINEQKKEIKALEEAVINPTNGTIEQAAQNMKALEEAQNISTVDSSVVTALQRDYGRAAVGETLGTANNVDVFVTKYLENASTLRGGLSKQSSDEQKAEQVSRIVRAIREGLNEGRAPTLEPVENVAGSQDESKKAQKAMLTELKMLKYDYSKSGYQALVAPGEFKKRDAKDITHNIKKEIDAIKPEAVQTEFLDNAGVFKEAVAKGKEIKTAINIRVAYDKMKKETTGKEDADIIIELKDQFNNSKDKVDEIVELHKKSKKRKASPSR